MEIKTTEIKLIPIDQLKHYEKNRNKHPEDQIAALADLIKAHGFRDPLTVDQDTMEVVTGNGTFMACKLLDMKEVPCILQSFETDEKKFAFSVSHNGISKWSEIDLSGIHVDLEYLQPFDIENLGIRNFQFEPPENFISEEGSDVAMTDILVKCETQYKEKVVAALNQLDFEKSIEVHDVRSKT